MKIKYLAIFMALSLMPMLAACHSHSHSHDEHGELQHEAHHHDDEEDEHGHDGHHHDSDVESHADGEIIFSPEKAERFGVRTTKIAPADFYETIKVSGQVLPAQGDEATVIANSSGSIKLTPAATVGTYVSAGMALGYVSAANMVGGDANEAARISLEAAKAELDRITPLYEDKIVTRREYIAARQAYEQARIAYNPGDASGSAVTAATAGTIRQLLVTDGQYVEAGAPVAVVSRNSRLLLCAYLPERYASTLPLVTSATFTPSYTSAVYDIAALGGRRTSSNAVVTAMPGYLPVLFEFGNDGTVIAGSYAEVYLKGAAKHGCIVVPVEAITEEQGEYFVYGKIDDEGYLKKRVTLGMSDSRNVEVTSGISPGEEIVTAGAVMLKMAANAGAVPGHTHNH